MHCDAGQAGGHTTKTAAVHPGAGASVELAYLDFPAKHGATRRFRAAPASRGSSSGPAPSAPGTSALAPTPALNRCSSTRSLANGLREHACCCHTPS